MDNYLRGESERLADQLFLIAHDDYSGKPLAGPDLLDTALAGAVLGELVFDGRIGITEGRVFIKDHRLWREPVSDRALGEIVRQGDGHAARAWLEFLRPHVREQVGERLVTAGLVSRQESRSLSLRITVRWPGLDPNQVAIPRVHLTYVLGRLDQPLDLQTATLAALVRAGGLIRVLNLANKVLQERIAAARKQLPPVLSDLLAAVDAAVAAAALTVRR